MMKRFIIPIVALLFGSCGSTDKGDLTGDELTTYKSFVKDELRKKFNAKRLSVRMWKPSAEKVELSHMPETASKDVYIVAFEFDSDHQGSTSHYGESKEEPEVLLRDNEALRKELNDKAEKAMEAINKK